SPALPAAAAAAPDPLEAPAAAIRVVSRDGGALRSAVAAASRFIDHPGTIRGLYDGSADRGSAAEPVAEGSSPSGSGLESSSGPRGHASGHHGIPTFRSLHAPVGERITHFYGNFADMMRDTMLPVVLVAALGLVAAGIASSRHESVRAQTYPLGFSEISQIEKDARYAGRGPIGPVTRYLTGTNDFVMKVMESYNEANDKSYIGRTAHEFAFNLDNRINYKFHRYEIQDYFKDLPGQAQAARAELAPFVRAKADIDAADAHLSRAWRESHTNHYHTHRWTTTEKNADGKGTHEEPHEEQVYDDTTHSYTYDAAEGAAGSAQLSAAIAADGALNFTETIPTASKTNAEGEYAADVSRKAERSKKGRLNEKELLAISQAWKTGSTLLNDLPAVESNWSALHGGAKDWSGARKTAQSDSYNTTSETDPGPEEYRVAKQVLGNGERFSEAVGEVIQGIDYTERNTPVVEKKVHQLIGAELDHVKGENPKKLTAEIVEISRNMYTTNFKKGLDFQRFRWDMVALLGALGALGGGLLGLLWKKMIGRFGWFK
ncbi:MAG: hypothetical protein ACHQ2Z_04480, partial [Elusimicrobiota bacterium]